MRVNIFGDRLMIDCHPRWKNGQPAQRTTGVLRMNCTQRDQSLCIQSGRTGKHVDIARRNTGRAKRRADPKPARHIAKFGVFLVGARRRRLSPQVPYRKSGSDPDDPARSRDASGRCSSSLAGKSDSAPAPFRTSDNSPARRFRRLRTLSRNIFCVRLAFLPRRFLSTD